MPPLAVQLLERLPSLTGQEPVIRELLEPEGRLLADIAGVAMQAGLVGAREGAAAESVASQIGAPELAGIALTILIRGYLQRAFNVTEGRRYWRYTLACAFCCSEFAIPAGVKSVVAHAGGLLHDLGRLALIAAYPDKYANLLILTSRMFQSNQPFNISEQERLLFGIDRFATGTFLAGAWQLPEWLHPLVGRFDARATAQQKTLVNAIRTGTRFAQSLGFGYLQSAPRMPVREILKDVPGAMREHWRALDRWKRGVEYMHTKIESDVQWYAMPDIDS